MRKRFSKLHKDERGIALPEMAISLLVLLTVIFGAIEISRLMWTVNALTDATRRGARYAIVNAQDKQAVRDVVAGAANSVSPALDGSVDGCSGSPTNSICFVYDAFDVGEGSVTVSIVNYQFNFAVPLVGGSVTLPPFKTTLTAESAGVAPPDPSASPSPSPSPSGSPSPSPSPTPSPDPSPSASPTPLPTCTPNQIIGSPPQCICNNGTVGNPPRCKP